MNYQPACLTAIFLLLSTTSQADSALYTIVGAGSARIDQHNATPLGLVQFTSGYRLSASFSGEICLATSLSGGRYETAQESTGQFALDAAGAYLVYRYVFTLSSSQHRVWALARAGGAFERIRISDAVDEAELANETGGSGSMGVGIGYTQRGTPLMVELGFTLLEKKVSLLALGVNWRFD